MDVTDGNRIPLGYQQIADLSAAAALTVPTSSTAVAGKTVSARLALIQAEGQAVRWRDDGTNPSASVGMRLLADGGVFPYTGNLAAVRIIQESGGAKLNVAYYY